MNRETQLDVLMISQRATWPLDQGFCVHGTHMALGLARQGLRVGLASMEPAPGDAPPWLTQMIVPWPAASSVDHGRFLHGWSGGLARPRGRLARYLGPDSRVLAGILLLLKEHRPQVVIGLGLHSPLMLHALAQLRDTKQIDSVTCIWYAADEIVNFHLSCMRRERLSQWPGRLRQLAQHAALEQLFARNLDGAIGVSPRDAQLLHMIAGIGNTIVIRNGVDLDFFQPAPISAPTMAHALAFWGRLDFEPNVDAACWFARTVWPCLRHHWPKARWSIMGKKAAPAVQQLAGLPGIEMLGEVADIRPHALAAGIAILPTRCGGGIKNKLLEAAAMGLPIVASPAAVEGLEFDSFSPPFVVCRSACEWDQTIRRLWSDQVLRADLGRRARRWVERYHHWDAAAGQLRRWLEEMGCTWSPSHSHHEAVPQVARAVTMPVGSIAPEPSWQRSAA